MTWSLLNSTFCFTKSSNSSLFVFLSLSSKFSSFPPESHYECKKSQQSPPSFSSNSIHKVRKKSPVLAVSSDNLRSKSASFIDKLEQKSYLETVNLLEEYGDWSQENFWDVIKFLRRFHRADEILQVFDLWKEKETSIITEGNYAKIIWILFEEGLAEAAEAALAQMKTHGLTVSPDTYDAVIRGFAKKGRFDDLLFYLKEMKDTGLKPNTETYDGLIQAYGMYGMYDEMGGCLKEMESIGSLPDHVTYNLLIRELSKAGLLKKMESTYQTLLGNRMELQPSTLYSMLEAYATFRILGKMEKFTKKVLNSKASVNDNLIRKVAEVYIENLMFSRLEELGLALSLRSGGTTDLVWCLRMLSHACACSRKGMYSVIQEMESNKVPWNATIGNIISLSYLKMKDFKQLNILLSELPVRLVKPDIVTVGIFYDACSSGFDGTLVKSTWRRSGFFQDKVEMETDPLVLTAFGKGQFLTNLEEIYSSINFKAKQSNLNYQHLLKVINTQKKNRLAQKVSLTSEAKDPI